MLLREARKLSRNSIRLILATARVIFNHAIEDGLIDSNPAAKLHRFAKVQKQDFSAVPLAREEAEAFLESAKEFCPQYYPLFLTALRAGLRRGELVALRWGDIQFGGSEEDANRYILVQRNYVYGQFTTPKSKKLRRVDLSRQLRAVLQACSILTICTIAIFFPCWRRLDSDASTFTAYATRSGTYSFKLAHLCLT